MCIHEAAITFISDTLYYWWYWTKGGAVLHLEELEASGIYSTTFEKLSTHRQLVMKKT